MDKKRYQGRHRYNKRWPKKGRAQDRRRMAGIILLAGLAVLILGILAYSYLGPSTTSPSNVGVVERLQDPNVGGAPKEPTVSEDTSSSEDTTSSEEEVAASDEPDLPPALDGGQDNTAEPDDLPVPQAAPTNSTMRLTIPKLGINGALVSDDLSEDGGLKQGVGHMPGTGFPWIPGSNTYIAGHRLGYPGTPSDHIFFNLPSMAPGDDVILTDDDGQTYTYRVSGIMQVAPTDLSVTAPTGSDSISLQVCIEDYNDFATLGPNWNVRLIVRGNRVA